MGGFFFFVITFTIIKKLVEVRPVQDIVVFSISYNVTINKNSSLFFL